MERIYTQLDGDNAEASRYILLEAEAVDRRREEEHRRKKEEKVKTTKKANKPNNSETELDP